MYTAKYTLFIYSCAHLNKNSIYFSLQETLCTFLDAADCIDVTGLLLTCRYKKTYCPQMELQEVLVRPLFNAVQFIFSYFILFFFLSSFLFVYSHLYSLYTLFFFVDFSFFFVTFVLFSPCFILYL